MMDTTMTLKTSATTPVIAMTFDLRMLTTHRLFTKPASTGSVTPVT